MRYLVDGYNLMHAIGLVRKGGGQASWERARDDLLHWLADQLGARSESVTVVFDAQNTKKAKANSTFRGLHVKMALGTTADDVIEDLVALERVPDGLTVVSNDQRVRQAAARSGCAVLRCRDYVDVVLNPQRPKPEANVEPEKPTTPTDDERDEWLRIFGG